MHPCLHAGTFGTTTCRQKHIYTHYAHHTYIHIIRYIQTDRHTYIHTWIPKNIQTYMRTYRSYGSYIRKEHAYRYTHIPTCKDNHALPQCKIGCKEKSRSRAPAKVANFQNKKMIFTLRKCQSARARVPPLL